MPSSTGEKVRQRIATRSRTPVDPDSGERDSETKAVKKTNTKHDANKGSRKSKAKLLLIIAISALVIAVKWTIYNKLKSPNHIDDTLKSMLDIESRVRINKNLNVAVGFGSCLDIFVSSKDLIIDQTEAPQDPSHHQSIQNQSQLHEVFAYFFSGGAAAERYIDNRTLFQELVSKANSIEGSRRAIGGNAAVMAKRFILEGVERVMLGTQLSKMTSEHFSDKLVLSGPIVDNDDIHICLEYPAGERWGAYKAPRANRLIIHSDYYNPSLESVDNFIERLTSYSSLDLLVIGGLQMMDNLPVAIGTRRSKLEKISGVLSRLPPNQPKVHLELASFTEKALLDSINNLVIPYVHSMGMNEQELPNLLDYLSKGRIQTRAEAYPRVSTTLDQMRELYQLLQISTRGRLSRIHTHTLAFQAIMIRKDSGWRNTLTSSVKAALTAHRYTCGSENIDRAKASLIMDESYTTSKQGSRRRIPFNTKHPVICWEEIINVDSGDPTVGSKPDTIEICVAPVLVCTKVKQTAGGGDNVSAAGLILQF